MLPQELKYRENCVKEFKKVDYTLENLLCVFHSRYINVVPVYNGAVCIAIGQMRTDLLYYSQMRVEFVHLLVADMN